MTNEELLTSKYDLTHKHGGCGWTAVRDKGDGFVKVCGWTNTGVDNRAFLACGDLLSITKRKKIGEDFESPVEFWDFNKISEIREKLKSGELTIVNTYIIKP